MNLKLNEIERKIWIDFHAFAYKDDLKLAQRVLNEHPRWAIIVAYYAMHNIAKLYLGKIHNIKVSSPEIHKQTIREVNRFINDADERKRVVSLLEKAEEEIKNLQPEHIPYLLAIGKRERGKAQYYSGRLLSKIDYSKKAHWFVEKIAKVFIKTMQSLVE